MKYWLPISKETAAKLREYAAANHVSSGFNSWVKETVSRMHGESPVMIDADDEHLGRTYRYAFGHGKGGWQNVFREVLDGIKSKNSEESLLFDT